MSVFWGVFVKSIFIEAGITGLVEIPDQSPHLLIIFNKWRENSY